MANQDSYVNDPPPGYNKPTHQFGRGFGDEFHSPSDDELLASYAAFTQRGVTLAGGQGVLPTGCVLAQHTSSKLYFAADQLATDGRQNVLGLLREARDAGGTGGTLSSPSLTGTNPSFPASPSGKVAQNTLGNLVVRGMVNLSLVSGQDRYSLLATAALQSGGLPPVVGQAGGIGSYAGGTNIATGVITQLQARVDTANLLFIF